MVSAELSRVGGMKIWAHRGASAYAPENSLAAFKLAVEQGADGIELDVQLTADGELVVCHDETIDRTSTGTGAIVDLTLKQLRQYDFSAGYEGAITRIPTLDEVFDLLDGTEVTLNIELKDSVEPYPGMAQTVVNLVLERGWEERVVISSFNHVSIAEMSAKHVGIPLGVLYEGPLFEPWNYAERIGAQALHPSGYALLIQPETVALAHERGLAVNVWTINDPEHARLCEAIGVDAIITNHPDLKW